jgi:hypothetical protein
MPMGTNCVDLVRELVIIQVKIICTIFIYGKIETALNRQLFVIIEVPFKAGLIVYVHLIHLSIYNVYICIQLCYCL